MKKVNKTGFYPAEILIPDVPEMQKWSVVACDQYTSQPEYWRRVRANVGDAPSTLNLIIPEAELKTTSAEQIHLQMRRYLEDSLFKKYEDSFVYLQRTQSDGKIRHGLVGMLDLECYDYNAGSITLCRATEKTVEERLPARVQVRRGAALELPHVMVLIDDPAFSVIEPLAERISAFQKVYNFDLMENGGHLTGYVLNTAEAETVSVRLEALIPGGEHPLLYAVGDGNHSLAAAKKFYEELKLQIKDRALVHPARFCLIELVNIHSPALQFEPIHRVLFNVAPGEFLREAALFGLTRGDRYEQKIEIVIHGERVVYSFEKETAKITLGTLQNALDQFLRAHPAASIDYIHGESVVEDLSIRENAIGFLLPAMRKEDLFPAVASDGSLPRKTFSMGNAEDKRFYLECRKII